MQSAYKAFYIAEMHSLLLRMHQYQKYQLYSS